MHLPTVLAGSYGVILIYRGHWCPFCNEQIAAFAGASQALPWSMLAIGHLPPDESGVSMHQHTAGLNSYPSLFHAGDYGASLSGVDRG